MANLNNSAQKYKQQQLGYSKNSLDHSECAEIILINAQDNQSAKERVVDVETPKWVQNLLTHFNFISRAVSKGRDHYTLQCKHCLVLGCEKNSNLTITDKCVSNFNRHLEVQYSNTEKMYIV